MSDYTRRDGVPIAVVAAGFDPDQLARLDELVERLARREGAVDVLGAVRLRRGEAIRQAVDVALAVVSIEEHVGRLKLADPEAIRERSLR